ncbi:MAG: FAD-dependent oxidoreductase [Bacteroidetes bacterium]|jgi:D-amino-acid oxidase|nr:FAD-dependent oxidoreductase [Bacteroidota bacterium]
MRTVAILGGGFSGLTTGVVLQLLGYATTIYTARRCDHSDPTVHHPAFASLYPAASVLPHTVQIDALGEHMRLSTAFFDRLAQEEDFGVRWQPQVEAFEQPVEPPPYAEMVRDFRMMPEDGSGLSGMPRRPGADALYGWACHILFAETPVYRPRLHALYTTLAGTVADRTLTPASIRNLSDDVVINCTGMGTLDLFTDSRPYDAIRGCLLHVAPPDAPLAIRDGGPFSYNYSPSMDVYPTADGTPGDVYFYPRRDAWVLGGSRRHGTVADGDWTGDAIVGPTVDIGGVAVPAPVLDLNRELIRALTGVDVADAVERAVYGYRFTRDLDGAGVRLELAYEHDHPVVHNVGHGGAGVTLSWGCGVQVARILHDEDLLGDADRRGVEFPPERAAFFADLQKLAAREVLERL